LHAIKLRAIHINHNLSPNAEVWAAHCKKICEEYEIECIDQIISLDLKPGNSLEETAREKRYAIFADYLNTGDILLTAHHAEDQAETVLLQLMRGAGVKGLAAMPIIKSFARGLQCRPFLHFPHSLLKQHAKDKRLKWIDDESNTNRKFARNFIRHDILPLLKKRWPSATSTIARAASHCAEADDLLQEFALELCSVTKGEHENTLSVTKLLQFSAKKQRLLLRVWIKQLGFPLPDIKKITAIQHDVFKASWDSLPCVRWRDVELRRYRDELFLMRALRKHNSKQSYDWDLTKIQTLDLPHLAVLRATLMSGKGLRADVTSVSIRFRQGGEIIDVPKRGRHTLKNLLQEWQVLPWKRNQVPLIFVGEQLIGVMGYMIVADFAAKTGEMGREFDVISYG
jgi:tRNA(Ile)-lysidine synthase